MGLAVLLALAHSAAAAPEDTLVASPSRPTQFLHDQYYSVLEDPSGRLRLGQVSSPAYAGRFTTLVGTQRPPNMQHPSSTYWLRFTVGAGQRLVPGAVRLAHWGGHALSAARRP